MRPITFCLLFLLSAGAFAQERTGMALAIDAANFRYDDYDTYVEMYYAFSRSALTFTKAESGYLAMVGMYVTFTQEGKKEPAATKTWNVPVFLADTTNMTDLRMIGRVNFIFKPGKYNVFLSARDENNPIVRDTISFPYNVRKISGQSVDFSDIEFASSIKRMEPDTNNIFYKNTLEVIPNPSALYGKEMPVVYYYVELYNISMDSYKFGYEVVNSFGKTVLHKSWTKKGDADAKVEIGTVNVASIPSGAYKFNLTISETNGTSAVSKSARFYVLNPDIEPDPAYNNPISVIEQDFVMLNEEELDERFRQTQYVSTGSERELWSKLHGSEAKKKYLTQFWDERDHDKSTPQNEFYMQYQERIAYCNQMFRSAYDAGWHSDRGRVYILYGPPDDVDRTSSGLEENPYEVWYYDGLEGGVEFVFVDRRNMGMYELVHSTMNGEVSNSDYDYLITK